MDCQKSSFQQDPDTNLVSSKAEETFGSICTEETSSTYQVAEPEASVSLFSP